MNVWCSCHEKVLVYDKFANNFLENALVLLSVDTFPTKVFFFFFNIRPRALPPAQLLQKQPQ